MPEHIDAVDPPNGITATKELRHIPALDGIRACAIGGVLGVHAGVPGFGSGWLGVDLFFALSGFLITTLLLSEWSDTGRVALRKFWVRRFLRLMPAYFLYALGISVAIWYWPGSVISNHGGWSPQEFTLALWFYLMNFPPMGGIWNGQELTIHLWSLAVEEQYYLLWPIFLCAVLKYSRRLVPVAWGLFAVVFVYFVFFATDEQRGSMLYARGISLFLASAVAVSLHRFRTHGAWLNYLRQRTSGLLMIAVIVTLAASLMTTRDTLTEEQVRHFLLPVLVAVYVAAVAAVWYGSIGGFWKYFLTNPVVIYIGKISYGIYLYHEVARVFTWWATGTLLSGIPRYVAYGTKLTIYVFLSIALAGVSYHFFERRFLKLKDRFR